MARKSISSKKIVQDIVTYNCCLHKYDFSFIMHIMDVMGMKICSNSYKQACKAISV